MKFKKGQIWREPTESNKDPMEFAYIIVEVKRKEIKIKWLDKEIRQNFKLYSYEKESFSEDILVSDKPTRLERIIYGIDDGD